MGCCMGGSRTSNDNGNDSKNDVTTTPDGTVIGQDGSRGGTEPYYSSPGGSSSPNSGWSGKYAASSSMHGTGANYSGKSTLSQSELDKIRKSGIGALSARNESGGDPSMVHLDNNNTYAYGTYQINVGTGTMNNYLKYMSVNHPDIYSTLSSACSSDSLYTTSCQDSPSFQSAWKTAAKSYSNFGDTQDDFITDTTLSKQISMLNGQGWDFNKMSLGQQQIIYSTAVQYGASNTQITNALKGLDQKTATNQQVINAISDYKLNDLPNHSGFTNSASHNAQVKRINSERNITLAE